jgi:hypothetical protein
MDINIDELIKDMNEVLLNDNIIERVEGFLDLLPSEELMELMKTQNSLTEQQAFGFKEVMEKIKPYLLDYKFHLDNEKKKLEKMQQYIY